MASPSRSSTWEAGPGLGKQAKYIITWHELLLCHTQITYMHTCMQAFLRTARTYTSLPTYLPTHHPRMSYVTNVPIT